MRTEEEVLKGFIAWANDEAVVRAAILTGSRVNRDAKVDFLSDYDIEMFVSDLVPFRTDDRWLSTFGNVMTRWPHRPRSTNGKDWITRLVLFDDGVRVDFQIGNITEAERSVHDYGYRILIDKHGSCLKLPKPTFSSRNIATPSRDEYEEIVHEFWWNASYVPKYLWRDELPFARKMMGEFVHDTYLRAVIEWSIGLDRRWSVDTGIGGRFFKRYVDGTTWREYESTYAGPGIDESWKAFDNAVALFSRLARTVGAALGYDYPMETEERMKAFYAQIRCGAAGGSG